jgi:hypothetical protein
MKDALVKALLDPVYLSHNPGDRYTMDGKGHWTMTYYPFLLDVKTGKEYQEPKALMECPKTFGNVKGIDFREVPLRYLKRK